MACGAASHCEDVLVVRRHDCEGTVSFNLTDLKRVCRLRLDNKIIRLTRMEILDLTENMTVERLQGATMLIAMGNKSSSHPYAIELRSESVEGVALIKYLLLSCSEMPAKGTLSQFEDRRQSGPY